jgi:hypothetical protein
MSVATRIRGVLGPLLPAPIRLCLRHSVAGRPVQFFRTRSRAAAYARHHARCRRSFAPRGPKTALVLRDFRWVIPALAGAATAGTGVRLPPDYDGLIERIARDVDEKLSWTAHGRLHPPVDPLPPRTDDKPEVRRGDVIIQKLANPLPIDGLNALCDGLLPSIGAEVFESHVTVDTIQVHRTYASSRPAGGSFLWHHDEFPREILKLLIYLTDVDADTAPFTYLEGPDGRPVLGSRTPLFAASRISRERMDGFLAGGCRVRQLTGPRGTCVLFSPVIVHRATIAARGHRDALFLRLRPSPVRRTPYVDERWTGTLRHADYSPDPRQDLPPPAGT